MIALTVSLHGDSGVTRRSELSTSSRVQRRWGMGKVIVRKDGCLAHADQACAQSNLFPLSQAFRTTADRVIAMALKVLRHRLVSFCSGRGIFGMSLPAV